MIAAQQLNLKTKSPTFSLEEPKWVRGKAEQIESFLLLRADYMEYECWLYRKLVTPRMQNKLIKLGYEIYEGDNVVRVDWNDNVMHRNDIKKFTSKLERIIK